MREAGITSGKRRRGGTRPGHPCADHHDDTHVDIPPDFGTEAYDPLKAKPPGQQLDLPGMESGGLDAAIFVVFVMQGERNPAGYARAMADAFVKYSAIRRMTDMDHPNGSGWRLPPRTCAGCMLKAAALR